MRGASLPMLCAHARRPPCASSAKPLCAKGNGIVIRKRHVGTARARVADPSPITSVAPEVRDGPAGGWCCMTEARFASGLAYRTPGARAPRPEAETESVYWAEWLIDGLKVDPTDQQLLGYVCDVAVTAYGRRPMQAGLYDTVAAAVNALTTPTASKKLQEWCLRRVGMFLWLRFKEAPFAEAPPPLRLMMSKLAQRKSKRRHASRTLLIHLAMMSVKISAFRNGLRYAQKALALKATEGTDGAFPNTRDEISHDTSKLHGCVIALCSTVGEGLEQYRANVARSSGTPHAESWALLFLLTHLRNHNDLVTAIHCTRTVGEALDASHVAKLMEVYGRCGRLDGITALYEQPHVAHHSRVLLPVFVRCCRCVGTPDAAAAARTALSSYLEAHPDRERALLPSLVELLALSAPAGDRESHTFAAAKLARMALPRTAYAHRLTRHYPPAPQGAVIARLRSTSPLDAVLQDRGLWSSS
eukprot:TRINITY_DN6179_c0_g1_i1.p1 TRINITY_DN6179_c0_g1~~TRINITY_DN6179_c0_g1_i1.p1  ORF type:complete len:473 (+),score=23.84 TRINITY_DN6179_c0_g1_i1:453-1871(+)